LKDFFGFCHTTFDVSFIFKNGLNIWSRLKKFP
jgi:hypothetical protein